VFDGKQAYDFSFVGKELISYNDANYPTITYKTFIGHSLGGLIYPFHQPHVAYIKLSSELCDYGTQQHNAGAGNASPYSIM